MTLADIIARRTELESRAAIRKARDAERNTDPTPAPKAPAKSGRRRAEDEPAMQGRNWLSEAREDLARVDAAPKVQTRRERPTTAPEYASSVDALQPKTENRTEPTTKVGGNADVPAAGQHEEPQGQSAPVGAASTANGADSATKSVARKMPQASAEHWTVRMARIDANVLTASFAPCTPIASPYDLPKPVRDDPRPAAVAGCGPPGW